MRSGEWRRERLSRSRLYVVTGGRREKGDLKEFLHSILGAGVDVVQLREKEASALEVLEMAEVFREEAAEHGALFILNDRADLALAAGADGVHLGQEDLPPAWARRILGEDFLVGRSTHAPEDLARAAEEPVDYVACGPVWETPTKPGRPAAGLEYVRYAACRAAVPWFAIGGIDPGNLGEVVAAGARRVAVVRAVAEARDPAEAVRALLAGLPPLG